MTMLNEPTVEKLYAMRLGTMAEAFAQQQTETKAAELGFEERFAMLVEAEFLARENRKLDRRMKEAKLQISGACIEDVEAPARRGLDKALLRDLATCGWVREHHNLLITGPTGVGKTYLACALGQHACRLGYRTAYRRVSRLFEELLLAQASGERGRLLTRLAKVDLLILDDWGIGTMNEAQRHDILEVLDDRYAQHSTIVTSQLPIDAWHDHIGDPSLADAVLDRLVHNAHKVAMTGPSKRKEKALKN